MTTLSEQVAGVLDGAGDAVVVINPRGTAAELVPDCARSVRMERNMGYAAAVNRGVGELDRACDIIQVLTHDAEISAADVDRLARTLTEEPRRGVVGPVIRIGEQTRVGGRFLGPGRVRHDVRPLPESVVAVDWVDGAILMFRRAVFDDVGGFDAGTFMYVDEVTFCLAAGDHGWGVVVDPSVVASQVPGAPARPRTHAFLIVRNHVRLARRRHGRAGALRAAIAGVGFAGRELGRAALGMEPNRRFHALSAVGGIDGAISGLRGRSGPPPRRVTTGTDVVLDG